MPDDPDDLAKRQSIDASAFRNLDPTSALHDDVKPWETPRPTARTIHARRPVPVREDSAPQHYAALDTPTITRRAEVPAGLTDPRVTPADPLLLAIVDGIHNSIATSLNLARLAELSGQNVGLIIRHSVANAITAASAEIAGEVERLRAMLGEAVLLVDILADQCGGVTPVIAAQIEAWRKAAAP